MRILTIANYLDAAGGLERTQMTNCRGLAERGHRIDLLYVHDGAFSAQWHEFTTSMTKTGTTLPRRSDPWASGRTVLSAVRHARRLAPDAVYAYRYWDLPFAVSVAARAPARTVYHLCLPPPDPVPRWMRPVLARVDATVSVSEHTLDLWRGSGLHAHRSSVALTSVDLAAYAPTSDAARAHTRHEIGFATDDFVVLFAGRLAPEKGVDVLIDAFRRLVERAPNCRLLVVGSPTAGVRPAESGAFEEHLHALGDGLPVTWLPRRDDVVPLLQTADVAVVPSRWEEPLSRSILEALACGVPPVASRVGGSPEVLTGWLDRYLFEPENSAELADRLASLRGWRTNEPTLGHRCRRHAEEHLAPGRELDLVEKALRGESHGS
jgi:glycosyltransferase involved in cell wall biosynthesis